MQELVVTDEVAQDLQIFGLLQALLEIRDWNVASQIFDHLASHEIDASAYPPVRDALINLVKYVVEDIYEEASPRAKIGIFIKGSKDTEKGSSQPASILSKNAMQKISEFSDLFKGLGPLLRHLNVYLSSDIILFTKICRLMRVSPINASHGYMYGNG